MIEIRNDCIVKHAAVQRCEAGFTIQEFLIYSLHPIRSSKAVSLKTNSRVPHVRNGGFLMPGLWGHERRNTQFGTMMESNRRIILFTIV